jgi:phosphatidylinositol alpha-1,6-mannosyltransferase
MPSLLVTNDFPPKVGGIQSYLWELWRRLPPDEVTVLTTAYDGAAAFDRAQPFRVERFRTPVLLPTPGVARRIDALATEINAGVIIIDPALPLGLVGRWLHAAPYAVVLHGAEVTVPGRLPASSALLRGVLRHAVGVVAAGGYPAAEAVRNAQQPLRGIVIPPGVDTHRFRPLDSSNRRAARARFGLDPDRPLVVGVSRLVPRKGFDTLIDAVAVLPGVQLAIAGGGRDRGRLARRIRATRQPERFHLLGRVSDDDLPDVMAMGDVFAMLCRTRWGGLEQEGFGIVFLEAAASAIVSLAGRSGGAHEAVVDGETGSVVAPGDVDAVRTALQHWLTDTEARLGAGLAARRRATEHFDYDILAARLAPLATGDLSSLEPLPLYASPS